MIGTVNVEVGVILSGSIATDVPTAVGYVDAFGITPFVIQHLRGKVGSTKILNRENKFNYF